MTNGHTRSATHVSLNERLVFEEEARVGDDIVGLLLG